MNIICKMKSQLLLWAIVGSTALQLKDTVTAPTETEFDLVPGKEKFVDPNDPVRTKNSDDAS